MTLRAQWLGQILRKLREDNHVTLKDAGDYLQKDFSTVSRFELGTFPVRRGDLTALMDLYGVDDKQQRELLVQLCTEAWQTGWWENYSADGVWGSTIDLVWLEGRAERLDIFAALTVPGLLQEADYARALFNTVNVDASREQIERWVELRMQRQRILEEDQPPGLSVVLDEAALRRPMGSRRVMSEQLRRLIQVTQSGQADIRVIPYSAGPHASPEGAFTLVGLEEPFNSVAHIESRGGGIYLERADVDHLRRVYDRLQESSLDSTQSVRFLNELEKDYQ